MERNALQNRLPPLPREGAALVLTSRWTVPQRDAQRGAADVAIDAWADDPWPDGLLSHSCLLGEDGVTIGHYSQWRDEAAVAAYWRDGAPRRGQQMLASIEGLERFDLTAYRPERSLVFTEGERKPGCVATVAVTFDGPDEERLRRWIATVEAAFTSDGGPPGLLATHFHVSTDGTRVFNLAEWDEAASHRRFVEQDESAAWAQVRAFPGLLGSDIRRYEPYRGLSVAP